MTFFRFAASLFLLALTVTGCTQRETDIGSGAIIGAPVDDFVVISGTASFTRAWNPQFSTGNSTSLEVGTARGLFVFSPIRFNAETALPDSFRVDSVYLRLNRNRTWGELGVIGIQVRIREVTTPWVESSLIPGTLPDREAFPVVDSLLINFTEDSLHQIRIAEQLWSRWIAGDTTTYGISIEPKSIGGFVEFYSSESGNLGPHVRIYGREWKERDGVWTDTSWVTDRYATHDGFLTLDSTERQPDRFFLSQGHAGRASVFFPIDSLLLRDSRSVTRAELRIYADTAHAAVIWPTGANILFKDGLMTDSAWVSNPDSLSTGIENSASGSWDAMNQIFTMNVTSPATHWMTNPGRNFGLQILASNELGFLARQAFFNHLADDTTKRPRLVIWLSEY